MIKNTISLIDIDSMFYQASNLASLEECIVKFKEKLNNCLMETKCTHWAGFTSKGKTFRHGLFELYKSNRTQEPPKYLQALKAWAIAEYNLNVAIGYESDDAVVYWRHGIIDRCGEMDGETIVFDPIICSPDKDILNLPGIHFNYSYKIKEESKSKSKETLTDNDFNKGWWVETLSENAGIYFWASMIAGDASDGVKGLEGRGIKYAQKLFESYPETVPFRDIVFQEYINHHGLSKGIYEFQKNYRLLHMLDCNGDFIREVGSPPPFPHINTVELKIEEIKIDIENVF